MGKDWDSAITAFSEDTYRAMFRVLKPGGLLLAFGGTRTFHRLACAIEDAGFILLDTLSWVYGQGFPKHKSKLKPAWEPIILATKPGPKWLGVDACRIPHVTINGGNLADNPHLRSHINGGNGGKIIATEKDRRVVIPDQDGRWPANFILSHRDDCEQVGERTLRGDLRGDPGGRRDGGFFAVGSDAGDSKPNARVYGDETVAVWNCHPDCPVRLLDEQSGTLKSGSRKAGVHVRLGGHGRLNEWSEGPMPEVAGDSGGASRFFFCSKASKADRAEFNTHPTVKSTNLMRWLCRLVCPEGGTVLDPFMGSGSTGKACVLEGFGFIGIEQEGEYFEIARKRVEAEVARLSDDMPLFKEDRA